MTGQLVRGFESRPLRRGVGTKRGARLLDLDSVGNGPAVLEAGYPLICCFLDEDLTFHQDWATGFYEGYTAGAGMSPDKKETLFVAALPHALRYLRFANSPERWARICYALEEKHRLLSTIATNTNTE